MSELLNNVYFVGCAMAVIIFFLTQVLKKPIKRRTAKIKDERRRRMANVTILIIPFVLGIAFDFLYSTFVTHTAFSIFVGLDYGTAAIGIYSIIERFPKVKVENPYDCEEGEAVVELVEAVSADKKVNKKDIDPVKDFLKKVK